MGSKKLGLKVAGMVWPEALLMNLMANHVWGRYSLLNRLAWSPIVRRDLLKNHSMA